MWGVETYFDAVAIGVIEVKRLRHHVVLGTVTAARGPQSCGGMRQLKPRRNVECHMEEADVFLPAV